MLVKNLSMPVTRLVLASVVLCLSPFCAVGASARAQSESAAPKTQAPAAPQTAANNGSKTPAPKPEDVVERAILAYGSRAAVYGVQRNGTLRALVKFLSPDGNREGKSITKFIRKPTLKEDLLSIELALPDTKYTIGFDGKDTWAIHNGEIQEPSAEAIRGFRSAHEHSYEALLRYKENNAKLEYAGSYKLATLELDLIDMVSAEGIRTRYEVSKKTGHIIYLTYEEKLSPASPPTRYRLYFKNFRAIQNTLVPYETVVYQNDKIIEERKVVEAVFNVQLDEKVFKAENATKPADAAPDKP